MTTASTPTCPACGATESGNYCSSCGASLTPRSCPSCRAELSPQARFCHRCGRPATAGADRPAGDGSDRVAWALAGALCVLLVGGIVYKVSSSAPQPAAPEMANAGAVGGDRGVPP